MWDFRAIAGEFCLKGDEHEVPAKDNRGAGLQVCQLEGKLATAEHELKQNRQLLTAGNAIIKGQEEEIQSLTAEIGELEIRSLGREVRSGQSY